MAHHIPEHKIIIVQTVIFIGLLVLLSFILDGCTSKQEAASKLVEDEYITDATPSEKAAFAKSKVNSLLPAETDNCKNPMLLPHKNSLAQQAVEVINDKITLLRAKQGIFLIALFQSFNL